MHDHFGEGGLKNYLNRQQRRDNIRKSTTVVAALIIKLVWKCWPSKSNWNHLYPRTDPFVCLNQAFAKKIITPAVWLDFQGRSQYACLRHLITPHFARSTLCFFYVLSVSQRLCVVSLSTFRKVKELTHQGIVA